MTFYAVLFALLIYEWDFFGLSSKSNKLLLFFFTCTVCYFGVVGVWILTVGFGAEFVAWWTWCPCGSMRPIALSFYLLNSLFSLSPGSLRILTKMLLLMIGTFANKFEISIHPILYIKLSIHFLIAFKKLRPEPKMEAIVHKIQR